MRGGCNEKYEGAANMPTLASLVTAWHPQAEAFTPNNYTNLIDLDASTLRVMVRGSRT